MCVLKVGPGLDAGIEVGPAINERARDDIASLVAATVDSGGNIVAGADARGRPGFFLPPHRDRLGALRRPHPRNRDLRPGGAHCEFDNPDEAIELANATVHGLISYVSTGDLALGMRVSEALETGMVGLNRGLVSDLAAPFGGVEQSGIGLEGGHHGLLEFMEAKYIATSW